MADDVVTPAPPASTPEAQAMAAVASAVSGPGTPDHASVTVKPDNRTVLALLGAGPALSLMLCGAVAILAFHFWPDAVRLKSISVMTDLVRGVAAIACAVASLLGLVVFRLASGGLKKVEARAGPAGLNIETGG